MREELSTGSAFPLIEEDHAASTLRKGVSLLSIGSS
jgi:hypothetical protein